MVVMKQRKRTMRYAWEDHDHDNIGLPQGPDTGLWFLRDDGEWVVPGGSGPENWLGDAVVRFFTWLDWSNSNNYENHRFGLEMADGDLYRGQPADANPTKFVRSHPRSVGAGLRASKDFPYSITHGFYFRATFGYGGSEDLEVWRLNYLMQGLGGSQSGALGDRDEPRFIGVVFGDPTFTSQRDALDAAFIVRRDGLEETVPAFRLRDHLEGHVMTVEIRTLPLDKVEVTLTDLNNGDTASHTFDGLVNDAVPNSNRFGTYADPLCLRPFHYTNSDGWNLVRWDSAEHTFSPWGNV